MKINWSLRFKNKATLLALLTCVVAFVYQILGIFGVTVPISEDATTQFVSIFMNVLMALGVVVDPTTQSINDSDQAMTYTSPKEN